MCYSNGASKRLQREGGKINLAETKRAETKPGRDGLREAPKGWNKKKSHRNKNKSINLKKE